MATNMAPLVIAPQSLLSLLPSPSFSALPSELLLHILTYLDIPDLLALSRVSLLLRHLSHDPLLHTFRLHRASCVIEHYIPRRKTLAELMGSRIYVTRTTVAARKLGRELVAIRLKRKLGCRPSVERLVGMGVLPGECYFGLGLGVGGESGSGVGTGNGTGHETGGKGKAKGRGAVVAPALVGIKRRIERERVKDYLRGWVGEWRRKGEVAMRRQREGEDEREATPRIDVRRMARRFAREERDRDRNMAGAGWGANIVVGQGRREAPPRAKVLGLRRFWERIGREGEGV